MCWQCIDLGSNLESCGGCVSEGKGRDCTSIVGVESVSCDRGQCQISQSFPSSFEISPRSLIRMRGISFMRTGDESHEGWNALYRSILSSSIIPIIPPHPPSFPLHFMPSYSQYSYTGMVALDKLVLSSRNRPGLMGWRTAGLSFEFGHCWNWIAFFFTSRVFLRLA